MARRKKITVETDNSDWQAPKKRKTRKPMSEEQRVAASEHLAKAREKRAEANPDYGKAGFAESIKDLPDDHRLHPDKVKGWIKTQKELLKSEKAGIRTKVKGSEARAAIHEGYIKHMVKYLRDGDWVDDFYGEHQEHKITRRCIAQAYHWYGPKKGEPKFDVGVYYPMLGCVYTKEMFNEEEGISNGEPEKRKRKGKRQRNTGPVAEVKKKG